MECQLTPTVKDKLEGEVLRLRTMLKVAGDTLRPDDALLSRLGDCLKDAATKIGQLRVDALIEEGL